MAAKVRKCLKIISCRENAKSTNQAKPLALDLSNQFFCISTLARTIPREMFFDVGGSGGAKDKEYSFGEINSPEVVINPKKKKKKKGKYTTDGKVLAGVNLAFRTVGAPCAERTTRTFYK